MILDYVETVDPDELDTVMAELQDVEDEWNIAATGSLVYRSSPLYNFLVLKQKHCVLLNKKMPYRSFRCIMSLSKKTL